MSDNIDAIDHVVAKLEMAWLGEPPKDKDSWDYRRIPLREFLDGLEEAAEWTTGSLSGFLGGIGKESRRRFLDVGCGIGTYMALASFLGWDVAGIERHPPYVQAARALLPEAVITEADACHVTKFTADVVYEYRLYREDEDERRLIRIVLTGMKTGSLLWLPKGAAGLKLPCQVGDTLWRKE